MKDLTHLQEDEEFQKKLNSYKNHYNSKNDELIEKYNTSIVALTDFPNSKNFENVWTELKEIFHEKQEMRCAICEKELNDVYSQDIEHYRPKTHYWWIAYDPSNYYLSCGECNRSYKKTHFPLYKDQTPVSYESKEEIKNEIALLLNPRFDRPNEYFKLIFIIHSSTEKGIAILKSRRKIGKVKKAKADKTIEVFNLDLNSYETVTDRSRFSLLNKFYDDLIDIAKSRLTDNKKKFDKVLIKKLKERPELKTLDLLKLILNKQVEVCSLII